MNVVTVRLADVEVEACLTALKRVQDELSGVLMRTRGFEDFASNRARYETKLRAVDGAIQALEGARS